MFVGNYSNMMLKNTVFFVLIILMALALPLPSHALEGRLNINTATAKQLQELPFIGHNKARSLIKYRNQHGPFRSLDDLQNTKAIGRSTYEAIKPYLTISSPSNLSNNLSDSSQQTASSQTTSKISTHPGQIIPLPDKAYYKTLRSFIAHATKKIDISMFIFKTTKSPKNKAVILSQDLIHARQRGVKVNLLLENSGYDPGINKINRRVARLLKKNKIKVRFESKNTTTHTKIVVIDTRFCFVGSHNFTHSALSRNHEFSLLVDSKKLAKELINYIKSIR